MTGDDDAAVLVPDSPSPAPEAELDPDAEMDAAEKSDLALKEEERTPVVEELLDEQLT